MAIPELQEEFAQYLTANYNYSHPRHMASEVFYSYRHDIGLPFEEIFRSDTSMEHAKELLIQYFERIGRKSPKGHAQVHYNDWIRFKEFLEHKSSR